jgi:hypothetical protein
MGIWGNRNKPPMKGEGTMKYKNARKLTSVPEEPECKKKECHSAAGGHRFKQSGAEHYCKKHAHPGNR